MSTLEETPSPEVETQNSPIQNHDLWESGLAPLELNTHLAEIRISVGTVTRDPDSSDTSSGYNF